MKQKHEKANLYTKHHKTISEITTTKAEHKVQSRLLLNVIISKGTSIFQLFPGKDEPLLIRWNPLLILNLGLDIINRVRALNLQCNSLPCQSLDKNLHTPSKTQYQVQSRLLLDIIIS
ncbi:hypothetical protein ACHQM5_020132 [Ranunculus cassubicifolius]